MSQMLFVYCEDPPLQQKGYGLSVLGYNILTSLSNHVHTVFTYGYQSYCIPDDLINDAKWNTLLLDSGISLQKWTYLPRFLKKLWQLTSFLRSLPRMCTLLRKHPHCPILINIGASGHPLWKAWIFKRFMPNPTWLYIVDDLERINQIQRNRLENVLVKIFLRNCLLQANRVLVISDGLKNKYSERYMLIPEVLLPNFAKITKKNKSAQDKESFTFVFSGGLSILYNDTLQIFYQAICQLNSQNPRYNFRLIIQTYSSHATYLSLGFNEQFVEYRTSEIRSSNLLSFNEADCFLIPYSFNPLNRDLVTTSFPQKVAELIQMERPLLVLSPSYGSVAQFFSQHRLPFVVDESSMPHLKDLVLNLADPTFSSDYRDSYANTYNNYFSQMAVFSKLIKLA